MNTIIPATEGLTAADVLEYVASGGTATFTVATESPEVIAARIDAEIMAATSIESLLGGAEVIHARDYLNRPFTLTDVSFRNSDIDGEGLPFYSVLKIVTVDGELRTMTTGARSVCMKVAKMKAEGWLPANLKLVEGSKTASGYTPLDVVAGVIHEAF